jgi:mRNA interferase MazF
VPIGPQDLVLATMIGHTISTRGSQFEVPVQVRFLQAGAFDAQSLVKVPHPKLIRKLGHLPPDQIAAVDDAVWRWLGL